MGAEQSRHSTKRRRFLRKRFSLPLQFILPHRRESSVMIRHARSGSSRSMPETNISAKVSDSSSVDIQDDQSFTEFEQDVLLSTWPLIASDKLGHGCMVFANAFNIYPHLKQMIPINLFDEESLCEDGATRRHILAFMNVFARAIDTLDTNRDEFYEEMMLLGARHAAVPGMKIEYFKVFKQAILMTWDSLIYEEFTEDVRRSWAHLIDYIIQLLSEGCLVYEEEEERILSSSEMPSQRSSTGTEPNNFQSTRRRSGRPSVVSMTLAELSQFYSIYR